MKKFMIVVIIIIFIVLGGIFYMYLNKEEDKEPQLSITYGGYNIVENISQGHEIKIENRFYKLNVTIRSISDTTLVIETDKLLTNMTASGGVNLGNGKYEHTLNLNEEQSLLVPVRDATIKYTFKYL